MPCYRNGNITGETSEQQCSFNGGYWNAIDTRSDTGTGYENVLSMMKGRHLGAELPVDIREERLKEERQSSWPDVLKPGVGAKFNIPPPAQQTGPTNAAGVFQQSDASTDKQPPTKGEAKKAPTFLENIQNKEWWMESLSDIDGDNRLSRIAKGMAYISTPLSKRGANPQDILRKQLLERDTLKASQDRAALDAQTRLSVAGAPVKPKPLFTSVSAFKSHYKDQIDAYRSDPYFFDVDESKMENIISEAFLVQQAVPYNRETGSPTSFADAVAMLKEQGRV